jgi:hypothetical protein
MASGQKRSSHPSAFRADEWFEFVELSPFTVYWAKLRLTDSDLWLLQSAILADPKGAPVIPGTGGVRKLRFSPRRFAGGKRDAFRVCYAYLAEFRIAVLALVYPKNK